MSALRVALVAGEHSGDQLGAKLMRALREARAGEVAFLGVGGEAMEAEGLESLFPISDIAVMGILPVLARLPKLLARIRKTAEAIVAARPDALVIIDSPDFTHRVARRVRAALPNIADRRLRQSERLGLAAGPGQGDAGLCRLRAGAAAVRARGLSAAERPALRLCRPSADRAPRRRLRPNADEARRRAAPPPLIVVLPGSRRSEVSRLMADFGGALARAAPVGRARSPLFCRRCRMSRARCARLPRDGPSRRKSCSARTPNSPRFAPRAPALAASGTVTLELALAGVPMVGAYKVSLVEEQLKYLIKVPSILLPNLILGERAIPEFLQRECTPAALGAALADIVRDGPARSAQLDALSRLDRLMAPPRRRRARAPTPRARSWRRSRRGRRRLRQARLFTRWERVI